MRYVAIDIECTGLDPAVDKVLEIACCPGSRPFVNETEASYESMVRFEGDIPPRSKAVHHILEHEVEDAPPFDEVMADVRQIVFDPLEVTALVAHHAEYEESFLSNELAAPWVCTERIAKHLWPGLESYGLQFLRYERELGISPGGRPHRALYDALTCEALFIHELAVIMERFPGASLSPEYLSRWANEPCLLKGPIGFGKHEGTDWSRLPTGYLKWMDDEYNKNPYDSWDRDQIFTVRYHLGVRR